MRGDGGDVPIPEEAEQRDELRLAESHRLYRLLDQNPAAALAEARSLSSPFLSKADLGFVRSAVLIDAGLEVGDFHAVQEGISLLELLLATDDSNLTAKYNLANGLQALAQHAQVEARNDPQWFTRTSEIRSRARQLFHEVGDVSRNHELRGMAKANLALMLASSGRWVEAYEQYVGALESDPYNAIASSGASRLLLHLARLGVGEANVLRGLAQAYKRSAQDAVAAGRANSGKRAERAIDGLGKIEAPEWRLDPTGLSAYERFVAKNRLVLSPTVEGIEPGLKRWDALRIASITESLAGPSGVPPIFSMFNLLKADFLAARWLAYRALAEPPPESGYYSDTLDYAVYGVAGSILTLAHRSSIDILDRVAVAASEYFELPGSSRGINFIGRWHTKKVRPEDPAQWQDDVKAEILAGNPALAALSELADDFSSGGFLNPQREVRHTATHRFLVLHDESIGKIRASSHTEHRSFAEWQKQTLGALRIARAAIIYLAQSISFRESRRRSTATLAGQLYVPSHHRIRGHDE